VEKQKRCFAGGGGSLLEAWGVVRVEDADNALSSGDRCCHLGTEQRAGGVGVGGVSCGADPTHDAEQPLGRNVKRFRGRLVFKAHGLLYYSSLD